MLCIQTSNIYLSLEDGLTVALGHALLEPIAHHSVQHGYVEDPATHTHSNPLYTPGDTMKMRENGMGYTASSSPHSLVWRGLESRLQSSKGPLRAPDQMIFIRETSDCA